MMRLGLPGGSTRIQTLVPPVTKMRVRSDVLECRLGISLGFEPITEGHRFEFDPDGVHNRNHGPCLELESR